MPATYYIRVKRGAKADLPAEGGLGELFLCTDTHELFAGEGTDNSLIEVGGPVIRHAYTVQSADLTPAFFTVTFDTGQPATRPLAVQVETPSGKEFGYYIFSFSRDGTNLTVGLSGDPGGGAAEGDVIYIHVIF